MHFVFVGKDYTATASGTVEKVVSCAKCQAEYKYTIFRSAQGRGTSPFFLDNEGAERRASNRASAKLKHELKNGADVVPCPACGHIQTNMVREARRRHLRWLNQVALLGLLTFPLWGLVLLGFNNIGQAGPLIPWVIFLPLVLACAGILLLLPTLRFFIALGYHPKQQIQKLAKEASEYILCEECGQEYLDCSALGPQRLRGVAPCPKCGRIQTFMFAAALAGWTGPWTKWPRMLMNLGGFFFLATLLFLPFAITAQSARDPVAGKIAAFWTIEAALFFAWIFLMLAGWWLWTRTFDPNTQDREHRLASARRVSKTREEIEAQAARNNASLAKRRI